MDIFGLTSKFGFLLVVRYLIFLLFATFSKSHPILGSNFGLFVATLPLSAVAEIFIKHASNKLLTVLYVFFSFINVIVLYFIGFGISKLFTYLLK
jgi:hypothetical protein